MVFGSGIQIDPTVGGCCCCCCANVRFLSANKNRMHDQSVSQSVSSLTVFQLEHGALVWPQSSTKQKERRKKLRLRAQTVFSVSMLLLLLLCPPLPLLLLLLLSVHHTRQPTVSAVCSLEQADTVVGLCCVCQHDEHTTLTGGKNEQPSSFVSLV